MSEDPQKMQALLLSYISLMAERNSFGPGDNFEYLLWDDLHGRFEDTTYVSVEEGTEIIFLATQTDSWVAYNDQTHMFEVIDMDAWEDILSKRGH
jgi:hypothetical protein